MYKILSTNEAVEILLADKDANWTYEGAYELVQWLEEMEFEVGERAQFDPVALRCDFSEYPSAMAALRDITDWRTVQEALASGDEEQFALIYLGDRTTVLTKESGGVVIAEL